jgi:acetyltransferase-like isoleucine patch superfamily enzyme
MIGAGSIVTKDIPDGVIAYGNPCKVIRENQKWKILSIDL